MEVRFRGKPGEPCGEEKESALMVLVGGSGVEKGFPPATWKISSSVWVPGW